MAKETNLTNIVAAQKLLCGSKIMVPKPQFLLALPVISHECDVHCYITTVRNISNVFTSLKQF